MKNLIVLVAIVSVLMGCQQKLQPDLAVEKESVKAVILKQLDAVETLSYEGEAAVWAHEPYIVKEGAGKVIVGWDSLSADYNRMFTEGQKNPANYNLKFTPTNFDIRINGTFAVCMYDEKSDGMWAGEAYAHNSRLIKLLEKKDGNWKIVAVY